MTESEQDEVAKALEKVKIRYKLSSMSFKTLCNTPKSPDRKTVLDFACHASEFKSFPIKRDEAAFFRHVNDHTGIPHTVHGAVSEPWHKVFLLVQTDLLLEGWPNKISVLARKELYQERTQIYKILDRSIRCIIDILGFRGDGRGVCIALDLLRSVKAGV